MTVRAQTSVSGVGGGVPAPLLLVAAMLAFQLGAAVATDLFAEVGVTATAFLRNAVGGLLLVAVTRPNLRRGPVELLWLLVFGAELAAMNVFFYEAIRRIPLGVAVTVEFVGPLAVALLQSRRWRDVVWVAMAAAGIALFAGLPASGRLDAAGLVFAALAGATWAAYIFTAQRVGRAWQGSQGLAAAMLASAVLLAPLGAGDLGAMRAGSGLAILAVGALAALPFSLEMSALRRLSARAYGVLASLEPAVATVVGLVALGQALHATDAVATLLVVTASVATSLESRG